MHVVIMVRSFDEEKQRERERVRAKIYIYMYSILTRALMETSQVTGVSHFQPIHRLSVLVEEAPAGEGNYRCSSPHAAHAHLNHHTESTAVKAFKQR